MPVNERMVDELERQWRDARNALLQENGKRYGILKRIIPEEELKRYLDMLTDKQERILFGLDLPEEPNKGERKRRVLVDVGERREGAAHDCPYCTRTGLTEKGLKLHITRMHKDMKPKDEEPGRESLEEEEAA